jgi:hypothetical protein
MMLADVWFPLALSRTDDFKQQHYSMQPGNAQENIPFENDPQELCPSENNAPSNDESDHYTR